jgi:hypothetical protein
MMETLGASVEYQLMPAARENSATHHQDTIRIPAQNHARPSQFLTSLLGTIDIRF